MSDQTQEDVEFEIKFYEKILERHPAFFEVMAALGDLYTKNGQFKKGLLMDKRLTSRRPDDPTVLYNLACSFSLTRDMDNAFETIKKAVKFGYDDFDHLEGDSDLLNLRHDSRFQTYYLSLLTKKFGRKIN